MYLFLQDSGVVDGRFDQLWKLKIPLKVKIFVWLVLRRRVLTVDLLLKRGWSGVDHCVMCRGAPESVDHLFLGCDYSSNLLITLLPHYTALRTIDGVQHLWRTSACKSGDLKSWELSYIATTWWFVWLERNCRRLEDKKREPRILLEVIRTQRELWRDNCP